MAGASSRATPWPWLQRAWVKPLVFVACLAPLAWLVVAAASNALGANPAEALIRSLGEWALRFVPGFGGDAAAPAHGLAALARLRRMVRLWAFAYALLHLLAYAWLDRGWWANCWQTSPARLFGGHPGRGCLLDWH